MPPDASPHMSAGEPGGGAVPPEALAEEEASAKLDTPGSAADGMSSDSESSDSASRSSAAACAAGGRGVPSDLSSEALAKEGGASGPFEGPEGGVTGGRLGGISSNRMAIVA